MATLKGIYHNDLRMVLNNQVIIMQALIFILGPGRKSEDVSETLFRRMQLTGEYLYPQADLNSWQVECKDDSSDSL